MSGGKVGKTTAAIMTLPHPVRVFLCEDDSALSFAYNELVELGLSDEEIDKHVTIERIESYDEGANSMLKACETARVDADNGKLSSIIVDPISKYDRHIVLPACEKKWADGRQAHKQCSDRLHHVLKQLKRVNAHIVMVAHFQSKTGSNTAGGEGRVPNMANDRNCIDMGAEVHQSLWLECDEQNKRHFLTSAKGAWGPGVRGLKNVDKMPADFGQLISALGMTFNESLEMAAFRAVLAKANAPVPAQTVKSPKRM